MKECLFCKIINRELKAEIIFENSKIISFKDVNPQAPFHALVVPKKHIQTLNHITEDYVNLLGELIFIASKIATDEGYSDEGYRTVFNCNEMGGQTVYHIHLHILAGRKLVWPPG